MLHCLAIDEIPDADHCACNDSGLKTNRSNLAAATLRVQSSGSLMQKQYLTAPFRTLISQSGGYCTRHDAVACLPQSCGGIHISRFVLNRLPGGAFRKLLAMAQRRVKSLLGNALPCAGPSYSRWGKAAW
jgi:hypothetical protein